MSAPFPGVSAGSHPLAIDLAADSSSSTSLRSAYWTPVVVLVAGALLLTSFGIDQRIADGLYAWQGHRWAYRSSVVAEQLIHLFGRNASAVAWLGLFAMWIVARLRNARSNLCTPLACLLLSTLLSTAVVAWMKSWSNMDCPWDLTRYGGAREFIGLFALRPAGMPQAACFPAGHASAGYAWMALYFFFRATRPQWRWAGLAIGIALGLLFGVTQQLRGAHFLSHDLWTAAICWVCALGSYSLLHADARDGSASEARTFKDPTAPCTAASWLFGAGTK